MSDFLTLLKAFNRKERFILMSQVSSGPQPLPVSAQFIEVLSRELPESMHIPDLSRQDYVLAMDFHLNWLAAALQTGLEGSPEAELRNVSFPVEGTDDGPRHTFERNQEDIDLLLCWKGGDDRYKMVLLEAKAHSGWSTKQLLSKSARFAAIFGADGERYSPHPVDTAIVLAGLKQPAQAHFVDAWQEMSRREVGMHQKRPRFVQLAASGPVKLVGEHDGEGHPTMGGGHWQVITKG